MSYLYSEDNKVKLRYQISVFVVPQYNMDIMLMLLMLIILIITMMYLWLQKKYSYWERKNVPHQKPTPFLGNYGEYILMKKCVGEILHRLHEKFRDKPYYGAYFGTEPVLVVQDPDVIKTIFTKDFYYFNSREIMEYTHTEVFGKALFFTFGDRWKVLRQNMTPMFSSVKMRNMFPLIKKCTFDFENMLDYETGKTGVVEIREIMARYTIACIGSCNFGVVTNSMGKETDSNPFTKIGKDIFEISTSRSLSQIFRSMWPALFYGLRFKNYPDTINNFFHKFLAEVFEGRQYKPSQRNDFIDLILGWEKNSYLTGDSISTLKTNIPRRVELKVDNELLEGAAMQIFAAGFETSAATLSFTLYELAKNQEAQNRAIQEVDEYLRKHDGVVSYDCVYELSYLQACIDESLRLYPILTHISREVVEDYKFQEGLILEKGLRIHVPVYHLHHNPEYFPEPEQYRPERFLLDGKRNIKPYTYLPFGEGPRICIGIRFSRMQTLPGLLTVLKKYRLELAEGMPQKVDLDARAMATHSKQPLYLKLVLREGWEERLFIRD